ncbi:hypothetical protein [Thermus scotoductus]|nr:hypothetical protein [Thermus scotoductus]
MLRAIEVAPAVRREVVRKPEALFAEEGRMPQERGGPEGPWGG